MWIKRDLSSILASRATLEAVVVLGPRQVGKSSLLSNAFQKAKFLSLDDLRLRSLAGQDPAMLFLLAGDGQVIIDEFQYAPDLLLEIKARIDAQRRARLETPDVPRSPTYLMSGSNQIQVESAVRESLAGRVSLFSLHGLSVNELHRYDSNLTLNRILFRGGFPELYVREDIQSVDYLNDYISTFVEKDIARSAGIQKVEEFSLVTRLLAARVGELVNNDAIAQDSGVAPKTIAEWRDVLDRAKITFTLPVYSTNLNTRLIKTPKVFFIDCGLLVRLQGHLSEGTILSTPQAGHIFENLVIGEALKTKDHFKKDWRLSYWRTKEGEELDLVVESGSKALLVEVKLGIQNASSLNFTPAQKKVFGASIAGCLVTPGGAQEQLSADTMRVPISKFADYLLNFFM